MFVSDAVPFASQTFKHRDHSCDLLSLLEVQKELLYPLLKQFTAVRPCPTHDVAVDRYKVSVSQTLWLRLGTSAKALVTHLASLLR